MIENLASRFLGNRSRVCARDGKSGRSLSINMISLMINFDVQSDDDDHADAEMEILLSVEDPSLIIIIDMISVAMVILRRRWNYFGLKSQH